MALEEFVFPDEKDDKKVGQVEKDEIEIEVVSDTPNADKNRKPLDKPVTDPDEEELQGYSDKVKARISELTHARHDERRAREKLEREHEEAVRLTQNALNENRQLKEKISQGATSYVSQSQKMAEMELAKAEDDLRVAHNAGDTEAFIKAQSALTKASLSLERAKSFRPDPLTTPKAEGNVQPQQTQNLPIQKPDRKFSEWHQKNTWFRKDDEMTGFALGLHQKLVDANYDPNSDEYYQAVDRRIREVFPKAFSDEPDNDPNQRSTSNTKKPANVVAPVNRSTSAKKIRLTETQVALAKRLGVPLEAYAKQVALMEANNG